ncbi:hypothetical protein [Nesterenkonia pannonica]|uniref:hypothetical protein n=1 Tax=Nesterenkonia pannonica TaxID=1548602 RepID=UPI00216481F2|nr:hypothetical protein [Nesterenkonia pannonica]
MIAGSDDTWQACEVSGQDDDGFGGVLTCDLDGSLDAGDEVDPIELHVSTASDAAPVTSPALQR